MKKSCWQLTVRSEFSAAHALRHYQGKCENIHGHNYHVEMTVEGEKLSQDVELVADFSVLKKILNQALETLDHCDINTKAPFDKKNPSAENISCYLWHLLVPLLCEQAPEVALYSVSVSEKSAQTATYREWEV